MIIGVLIIATIIYVEYYFAKKKKLKLYTFSDSVMNISCGLIERVFDFFYAVLFLIATNYIYTNLAPFQIPSNLFTGILALLIFDFLAYWHHRWSHEVNFLWASHIVHHQSEELNLTTVFRVSFFGVINRSAFFILMPFIGFDALTILICGVILGFYQLFTHSRLIGKLGILESIIITPSQHRVHHARNEKYLDHNYGHIFVFWDKLFGSYVPETEEPVYGITSGFTSTNPFTAQFSYWKNLIIRSKKANTISDKINVFIKGPEWTPENVAHLPPEYLTDENGDRLKFNIYISKEKGIYILLNTIFTFTIFIFLLLVIGNKNSSINDLIENKYIIALVILILFSVFSHGKMLEQSKNAYLLESFRLIIICIAFPVIFDRFSDVHLITYGVITWCVFMFLWLFKFYFLNGDGSLNDSRSKN